MIKTVLSRRRTTKRPHAKRASLFSEAEARNFDELDAAWKIFIKEQVGGVMVQSSAFFYLNRHRVAQSALAGGLPTIFVSTEYAEAGGLMGYGENLKEFYRRAGRFVDKIFKGEKPGDLPIEQPTRFNLVINRKTASALGLDVPVTCLYSPTR